MNTIQRVKHRRTKVWTRPFGSRSQSSSFIIVDSLFAPHPEPSSPSSPSSPAPKQGVSSTLVSPPPPPPPSPQSLLEIRNALYHEISHDDGTTDDHACEHDGLTGFDEKTYASTCILQRDNMSIDKQRRSWCGYDDYPVRIPSPSPWSAETWASNQEDQFMNLGEDTEMTES